MENIIVAGTEKINLEIFKVNSSLSEDEKTKVREYGKLLKAKEDVVKQLTKLETLIDTLDAGWCKKHLWTNKLGEVVPLFEIDDDYLKNIIQWMLRNNGYISKEMKKEYYSRFGYSEIIEGEGSKYAPKKFSKRGGYSFSDDNNNDFD